MTAIVDNGGESILEEAQRLTHGTRNKDYGHPLDDYSRTAALINALFAHKLKQPLDAEDAAQIQILVKLSRHQNVRKRDNMTDLAGYGWVAWACTEERERRTVAAEPLDEVCWLDPTKDAPVVGCECEACTRQRRNAERGI